MPIVEDTHKMAVIPYTGFISRQKYQKQEAVGWELINGRACWSRLHTPLGTSE